MSLSARQWSWWVAAGPGPNRGVHSLVVDRAAERALLLIVGVISVVWSAVMLMFAWWIRAFGDTGDTAIPLPQLAAVAIAGFAIICAWRARPWLCLSAAVVSVALSAAPFLGQALTGL